MKDNLKKIVFVIAVPVLIQCGPKPVVSTIKNSENLNRYETYAYLPNTDFDISSPHSGNNVPVTQAVIATMNRNMQEKGYTLNRDNPDLLVVLNAHYDSEVAKEVEMVYANPEKPDGADPITAYYDPYYYWKYAEFNDILGFRIKKVDDKRAGLAIELIDRGTEKVVWRGTAKEPLNNGGSSKEIADYVAIVFEAFPEVAKD